jgi:hypothetical protein
MTKDDRQLNSDAGHLTFLVGWRDRFMLQSPMVAMLVSIAIQGYLGYVGGGICGWLQEYFQASGFDGIQSNAITHILLLLPLLLIAVFVLLWVKPKRMMHEYVATLLGFPIGWYFCVSSGQNMYF